jgi:hypothetical protein
MRCSSLRPFSLVLGLGLALACSSANREPEPDRAIESEVVATSPATPATEEPHAPTVGAPAPALDLVSLAGTRVQLPDMASERATVLIFGSFS